MANTVILTKSTVTGAAGEVTLEQLQQLVMSSLGTQLMSRVNALLERYTRSQSTSLQLGLALMQCSYLIAPKTLAAILGQDRDRFIPEENDPPSAVIASLAPQGLSDALVLTSKDADGVPRVFVFDTVRLDQGTSFNDITINIYVGGTRVARFDGTQLNPGTNNACVTRALCQLKVCVGALQDLSIRVRNDSDQALGDSASIRIHGRVAFPGDPDFVDCWAGACGEAGLTAKLESCSCKVPTGDGGGATGWEVSEPPM